MVKQALAVRMNGLDVGKLRKLKTGALEFIYENSWLQHPARRPISLSMPLVNTHYQGDVVYNFFDNLLPDHPTIRARLQQQFHASSSQPFDLLSCIGRDCIGAIQICDESFPFQKTIEAESLSDRNIANILKNYKTNPFGMNESSRDFRISLAGTQEKTALLYHNKQWLMPLGSTPTTHILKLPIGQIPQQGLDLSDSCENEWLCGKILEGFGLPVAKSDIQSFSGTKVLVVERFDRKFANDKSWIMRLPQEDFCQALGYSPNLKYQTDGGPGVKEIMSLLRGADQPNQDQKQFMKTQIIFWLLGAIDGHAKNFSVFINQAGGYSLTPLYDIISAYPMLAQKQLQLRKLKMAMALLGKNKHYHLFNFQRRHLISTADNIHFPKTILENLFDEITSAAEPIILNLSKSLPRSFPVNISEPIFEGLIKTVRKL